MTASDQARISSRPMPCGSRSCSTHFPWCRRNSPKSCGGNAGGAAAAVAGDDDAVVDIVTELAVVVVVLFCGGGDESVLPLGAAAIAQTSSPSPARSYTSASPGSATPER